MLETLTLDAVSTTLDAEPEVVIDGITFDEGKLWKARYPSLVDYSKVLPRYQVEPAIQITDPARLQMTVRLTLAEEFVFQTEGAAVKYQWVDGNGSPPPSCISAVLEFPGTCLVTWTREPSSPSTIALRFFCGPKVGMGPTDPESVVEGGVYLTFVVREETWPDEVIKYLEAHQLSEFPEPSASAQESTGQMKVRALLLPKGHIKYNLFTPDAPAGTEFELAFRVRRGAGLGFYVEIINPGFVYREKLGAPGQVAYEITHHTAPNDPLNLETPFGEHLAFCQVIWKSTHSDQDAGLSCSFNLIAELAEGLRPFFRPVDPTVIEPPRCTGGICAN